MKNADKEVTSTFDPLKFGFQRVNLNPSGYSVYEQNLGSLTEKNPDFLRLNLFLSQADTYVTIWWGLFDPVFAEGKLEFENSHLIDFHDAYFEYLFKGTIKDNETAKVILEAVAYHHNVPSKLVVEDGEFRCDLLDPDYFKKNKKGITEDGEALPHIVAALDSVVAGETGLSPDEVKKSVTAHLKAKPNTDNNCKTHDLI